MEQNISIEFVFKRLMRDWWILALTGVIGAGIGWLIFINKTPQYQAEGFISIGIDFTRTGQLTDIEEDQMIGITGDILNSPGLILTIVEKAKAEQIQIDEAGIKNITKSERRQNQWVLIVRHGNPSTAEAIARIWTEEGYQALISAMGHADRAGHLQRYLDSLESCLQRTSISGPTSGVCTVQNILDLQKNLDETGKIMAEEKVASMGMLPGTTITLTGLPSVPEKPIEFGQGQLVLAGCLAGILLGISGIFFGWTDRLQSLRSK